MSERITKLETYRVRLPFGGEVKLRSVQDVGSPYLILRIETQNGAAGIAESFARAEMSDGTDLALLEHQIVALFKPALVNADVWDVPRILAQSKIRYARAARSMIDIAVWDLKGKLLNAPVWKLIGAGPARPIPVTKIVFGNTVPEMIEDAVSSVNKGYRSLKIKVWKRSMQDINMVRDIRAAVGPEVFIYVDANTTYTETEARYLFPRLLDYDVKIIEDPCHFTTFDRMADLARDLPIPIMSDAYSDGLPAVYDMIRQRATGAISAKMRRIGLTETLKIIAICEAANIPVVVGTDLESRLGVLPRIHLRTGHPYLENSPAELQFFEQIADDCLLGELRIENGMVTVPDAPGFGAQLDMAKLEKYRER